MVAVVDVMSWELLIVLEDVACDEKRLKKRFSLN
jgi:hypothetical protein